MAKVVYRGVATNEEAIALGYPNVQSYRLAVRKEQDREARLAYADTVARHQAEQAAKLKEQGPGRVLRVAPQTTQQAEAMRALAADRSARGDGE
jgi:hypothetical protein